MYLFHFFKFLLHAVMFVSINSMQAYDLGLTLFNGYLWLSYAWYPDEWWTEPANRTNYEPVVCPREVLESMIEHSIIIDHYAYVLDKNSSTDVGIVCASWSSCMEYRPSM